MQKKNDAEAIISNANQDLVAALIQAIQATKPVEKKNPVTRKPGSPWHPKDGSPKLKLKRKMYQHGLLMDADLLTNDEIDLLNKVKPGRYLDNWVKVIKRQDKGINIDYPVKTVAQRLKLGSAFGVNSLTDLLKRLISESENPTKFTAEED